jgi:hypothetical protein
MNPEITTHIKHTRSLALNEISIAAGLPATHENRTLVLPLAGEGRGNHSNFFTPFPYAGEREKVRGNFFKKMERNLIYVTNGLS